jgi:glycosyltransferase involved in cell wall biosynthesis
MRILHIGKYYPPVPGGMERFLGDLVEAQRAAGHEVAVLCHDDGRSLPIADPGWLWRCPVWFKLAFAPISPAFPFWMRRAIESVEPDVLHVHMPNLSAFWALFVPLARRIPCIVHWHADVETGRWPWHLRLAYELYRVFERELLEHTEIVIATSRIYLESSEVLQPWREKCHVLPLGVALERLPESPPNTSVAWLGQGTRLLAIGRLTYYKGFDTLIEAVAGLDGVELIVVGAGEEQSRLEDLIERHGRPSHIRLAGELDDANCHHLLATCDIYCLPSRERTEAFGVVLMEAMRYSKPLLASRLAGSGVTWVAREEDNALLVEVDDVGAWKNAISGLAANDVLRAKLGAAGGRRFLAEFDIERVAIQLNDYYRRFTGGEARVPQRALPLVVIPALNEAESIRDVVKRVRQVFGADVLVVDDGSRDDTARLAIEAGARVLRPILQQGAWGAMQTGIRYAVRHGYPAVVTMDADGQHEPAYLDRMLDAAREADVVIGACPERGSRPRRFAWGYFRFLTGFGIEDLTSGFRYYNAEACRLLGGEDATLLDYQDIGVLLMLRGAGLRVKEVSVDMNPRQYGASRIFYSWWSVARYMAETTLLCMARWNTKPIRK